MARGIAVAAIAGLALALAIVPLASAASPSAVTGAATSVGASSAVVGGKVGPGGEETSWYVEYGTTTAYGSRTGARSAGNGTAQVDVTEQLAGPHDGRDLPLSRRRDERHRDGPRRRPDVHDAGRACRRHEPGERARPDLGHRCGDGRPERQLDGLVGGVRHEHELRVTDRHAVGRSRARAPSASRSGCRASAPGSRTTSASSRRTPSARHAAATGASAPTPRRPSRPAASTASPSPRHA